jgi:magnesium transporter
MSRSLLQQANPRLAREYLERHPGEVARLLERTGPEAGAGFLTEHRAQASAAVLASMTPAAAADVVVAMDDGAAAARLNVMDPQVAARMVAACPDEDRERLLAACDAATARELRSLAAWPPDTAGALMDPRYLAVLEDEQLRDIVRRLRRLQRRRVSHAQIVDEDGRFLGRVPLQDVLLAPRTARAGELPREAPIAVPATATREEVVELIGEHRLMSVPVVDFEGRLLGVIRSDMVLEAASDEASLDIQTMVGVSREERALSPVWFAVKKRLPWLHINLLTAFAAASVVGLFEDTIARYTALAVLLPVVAGQSGNTGAQALAVVLRGLALREVRTQQWARLATKEAMAGLANGVAVAVSTCVGVWFWSGSAGLCVVIGAAMVSSMVLAGLAGAAIPMVLTALDQDPAQSSSIILTTVTDITGFASFLGLATIFSSLL